MADELSHSRICTVTFPPKPVQSVLELKGNALTYRLIPPHRYRTPAPNAVKRIANDAVFTSSDRQATSFLRFPPEIRIEIYRLLLISEREAIAYSICTLTQRFVVSRRYDARNYPWTRHGLFPAILECCKTLYAEGSQVLYGENKFYIGCHQWRYGGVVHSWPVGKRPMECMTQLKTYRSTFTKHACTILAPFLENIKTLEIHMESSLISEWSELLTKHESVLAQIPSIRFTTGIDTRELITVWNNSPRTRVGEKWKCAEAEDYCVGLFKPVIERCMNSRILRNVNASLIDASDWDGPYWILFLRIE